MVCEVDEGGGALELVQLPLRRYGRGGRRVVRAVRPWRGSIGQGGASGDQEEEEEVVVEERHGGGRAGRGEEVVWGS